ncbi:MAG: retropepsin-like aspartic protease [Desulfurivibrionaceae bacterium]
MSYNKKPAPEMVAGFFVPLSYFDWHERSACVRMVTVWTGKGSGALFPWNGLMKEIKILRYIGLRPLFEPHLLEFTMEFLKLILVVIVCVGLSLFGAYKMILFFSDENEKGNTRRGRAKKFFQNNMGRNEKERKLYNDQFNWEVFKTRMQAHVLPAAMAGLLVVVILNVMTKPTQDATKTQTGVQATPNIPPPAKPQSDIIPIDLQAQPVRVTQQQPSPISSWNDQNGQKHYTNTTPQESQEQGTTNNRETPVLIENNQVLVPVVIGHKGRAVKAYFLLDTGCTTTLLYQTITERIQPDIINTGTSTVADGRKIETNFCKVDFIQVGPFTENNFTATTNYVAGKDKYHGLLGMEFLKKHPFQIDTRHSVIRWM